MSEERFSRRFMPVKFGQSFRTNLTVLPSKEVMKRIKARRQKKEKIAAQIFNSAFKGTVDDI